jgi:hypothetical protein
MKKLPINKIPSALAKWTENLDDFWFGRFIRSIGYTKKELALLAKKHKKIDWALKLAMDSFFDKIFYKIMAGYITPDVAEFLMGFYGMRLNLIKPRDAHKYIFETSKENNFSDFAEDDSFDSDNEENENERNTGEFKPFITIVNKNKLI